MTQTITAVINLATTVGRQEARVERELRYDAVMDSSYLETQQYLSQKRWVYDGVVVENGKGYSTWIDPRSDGDDAVKQSEAIMRQVWRDMWAEGIIKS